jgi:hypothetical protein
MEHKWLKFFDQDGNWTRPERTIKVDGVEHDLDEYAKEHGIELPTGKKSKPKKHINIDIKDEDYADLEQSHDSEHTEIDGDGDSEGSE